MAFILQSIYISRVTEGGVADRDGKLAVGDRIISVRPKSNTNVFHNFSQITNISIVVS